MEWLSGTSKTSLKKDLFMVQQITGMDFPFSLILSIMTKWCVDSFLLSMFIFQGDNPYIGVMYNDRTWSYEQNGRTRDPKGNFVTRG